MTDAQAAVRAYFVRDHRLLCGGRDRGRHGLASLLPDGYCPHSYRSARAVNIPGWRSPAPPACLGKDCMGQALKLPRSFTSHRQAQRWPRRTAPANWARPGVKQAREAASEGRRGPNSHRRKIAPLPPRRAQPTWPELVGTGSAKCGPGDHRSCARRVARQADAGVRCKSHHLLRTCTGAKGGVFNSLAQDTAR
jgi:hypothetical protein